MSAAIDIKAQAELRIKRAHIRLMRHELTYYYSGVMLLGNTVVDMTTPTACTDGLNVWFGADFIMSLSEAEVAGVVLHEHLHKFLKHLPRHRDLMKENGRLANAAMDYVDNSIIKGIERATNGTLLALPACGLYDETFDNWSVREIYNFLNKCEQQPQTGDDDNSSDSVKDGNGKSYRVSTQDEHDVDAVDGMDADQIEELGQQIDDAIQQSALLAGLTGAKLPRAITELLQPEVDWVAELREFMQSHIKGSSEHTWRKFNRRRIVDDLYRPGTYTERMGRVLVAIDTSGSISNQQLARFGGELASICEQCRPDEMQVLWWDTQVHGMQQFDESSYANIRTMLKPMGFGGTRVGCVSDYIKSNNIDADCLVVFTDGYVESPVAWDITLPTLWVVVGNESFVPPRGVKVKFK
jgi:predicted metal-dependent peptidase